MATAEDLQDVIWFLNETLPFSALNEAARLEVAKRLSVSYLPRRQAQAVNLHRRLYIIRTGAFELRSANGDLVDRLGESDLFGLNTLMRGNPDGLTVFPIEDSLVFTLEEEDFHSLCRQYAAMAQFFQQISQQRSRLSQMRQQRNEPSTLQWQLTQNVKSCCSLSPVVCQESTSIQEAAALMREHRVSSLLVQMECSELAIVTDRDLRNRVVAEGGNLNAAVLSIATLSPVCIESNARLFDAQQLMGKTEVHHLPVLENGQLIGMLTATDLIRAQQTSPLHLIDQIRRQSHWSELFALREKVPPLIHHFVQAEVNPQETGRVLAAISDAFTQQCLTLAQQELGDAPMPFAWLSFGSQARMEQTFISDQDNGLILARAPGTDEKAYFQALTEKVCHGLEQCGYPLCPGDIMASNPRWRKSLEQWQEHFSGWIDRPTPEALLNSNIFFDLRVVAGEESLLTPLLRLLQERLPKADLFLALLTQAAVRSAPPIGFFRRFLVDSRGDHQHELDMKHRGVALVNDLARLYALAAGVSITGTCERLQQVMDLQRMDPVLGQSLQEAWTLMTQLRLEEQSRSLKNNESADGYLNPERLSSLMRAYLKDAFATIKQGQEAVLHAFARGQRGA